MIVRRIILNPSEPRVGWRKRCIIDVGRTQFPELYFDPYEYVVFEKLLEGRLVGVRIVVCEQFFLSF